jgi:UTP:GlnB (protein PII) uridylyltransferase
MVALDAESVAEFEASMPAPYRECFDAEVRALHAGIVARREAFETRSELWRELPERVIAVCVVADDRPGLLSQISAALVALEIDIVTAHAYCRRRRDGVLEAVDLLWLRRVARPSSGSVAPLRARDVAAIGAKIDELVRGDAGFDPAVKVARALRRAEASTRVRFEEGGADGTTVLTVESTDQPGLLLVVTKAIFRAGLQILALRATSEQGRATDRFHLAELDGKPLAQARLLGLQVEILTALEDGDGDRAPAAATG